MGHVSPFRVSIPRALRIVAAKASLGEQEFQVFRVQVSDQAVVHADHSGGKIALGFLQFENLLLDGVARDQPIGENLMPAPRSLYPPLHAHRSRKPRIVFPCDQC
jgi:hypothetical protein